MKKIFLAIAALAMIAMGANAQTTGTAERTGGVQVNWVQLWENGPKFAEYNVGAANNNAEDYGGYYKWGGSQDKGNDSYTGTGDLTGNDDTATNLWGENWRMPTADEFQALIDNCDVEWTTVNGVGGNKYTGKGEYAANSIFLPAAGDWSGAFYSQGEYGYYFSSSKVGCNLFFLSDYQVMATTEYNSSVRAVYDVKSVVFNAMAIDFNDAEAAAKQTMLSRKPSYQFVGANKDSIQAYKNGALYGEPIALAEVQKLGYNFVSDSVAWYFRAAADTIYADSIAIDEEVLASTYATIAQADYTYNGDTAKATVTLNAGFPIAKDNMAVTYYTADDYQQSYVLRPGAYATKLTYDIYTAVDSFAIAKASATVTAVDTFKVYGSYDPESFRYTTEGLVKGDELGNIEVSRAEGETVGTYKLTAEEKAEPDAPARVAMKTKFANAYYNLTFNEGVFTINPMELDPNMGTEGNEFFMVSAAGYCQGDEAGINYAIEAGEPVAYSIAYSAEAKAQGFVDVPQTAILPGDIKSLDIIIPANCHYGKYNAVVSFHNALGIDPIQVPLTFIVNIPSVDIKALFNDVVAIDNNEGKYTSYQWYHNGELIPGANLQYYQEKGGLTGSYYVEVTVEGLDYEARSCEEEFKGQQNAPAVRKVLRSNTIVIITPEDKEYNVNGQTIK